MGRSRYPDFTGLTRRQVLIVLAVIVFYLAFQTIMVGLKPMYLVIPVLFTLLYFPHPVTRRIAIALLPFVLFAVTYDWMRLFPNYEVRPIDIRGLHDAELSLFGITADGATVTPNEYFLIHNAPFADLMAGIFYLCWVPVPVAFGLWLYLKGERKLYLHFALVFLLVNWLGFIGYYIHPAAPPWYAIQYGYEPIFSTLGNAAGLERFDNLVGIPVFQSIYVNNANIFAAIPSLHAAYILITTFYSVMSRQKWYITAALAFITVGIWWTAVYACHHYIIDVLLGITTAIISLLLFEQLLMRIPAFRRFVDHYTEHI